MPNQLGRYFVRLYTEANCANVSATMKPGTAAMQTALRVLGAIADHRRPDPADLDELRQLAPLLANAEVDELACDVIQQAVKRRTEVRARAAAV